MTHILFFYVLSLCFHSGEKDDSRIQITPATSQRVTFSISNAGVDVHGTLKIVKTEFNFDPQNLGKSSITASADPSTITTGIGIRDKHLQRKDYFDVDQFSEIHLRSLTFRKAGKNKFVGDFHLTIKDITKAVRITFERQYSRGRIHFAGAFEINRIDFNLGEKSVFLENEVAVEFDVECGKQN
jgi:polyisoprenoid-binding protein YceI